MLEKRIHEALNFVAGYAGDISDWTIIKKELLKILPVNDRTLFSTRDPLTKSQSMNEFEIIIAEAWRRITGNQLILITRNEKKRR